jgi:phenylpropionate dioxygenase-like ring-hydroxylating dioxygenase large terminal subunit
VPGMTRSTEWDTSPLAPTKAGWDLGPSTLEVAEAVTLPPGCYTDEDWYRFEQHAIFGREWLCLGRASAAPEAGDYFTVEVAGEPLIVVRDAEGEIRVLSAVCQHRAMLVAEGSGHCRAFRCPYHHWTYAWDGRLIGAPAMDRTAGFDRGDYSLPQIRSEIWQGFVFANLDPQAAPLTPRLAKLEPLLANFGLEDCREYEPPDRFEAMPWNWKVMLENFNDGYHANRLHAGVHDFCPSDLAQFVPWKDEDAAIVRTNGFLHPDGGFNALQQAMLPLFPSLTPEEHQRVTFALLPPSLTIGLAPDQVFYFLIRPRGPGSVDIEIGYLFDPQALRSPLFEERYRLSAAGVAQIVAQDVAATTAVQRGLASRYARRSQYSWQEEAQRQLNCWLVQRYQGMVNKGGNPDD